MTDKTEGLEVVAWKGRYSGVLYCPDEIDFVHEINEPEPLVTLASAQAAVAAERELGDRKMHDMMAVTGENIAALEAALGVEQALSFRAQVAGLEEALGVARETCIDVTMGLERARIWAGMDWAYQPIHPVLYRPLIAKAKTAQALIDTTLGVKT